MATIANLMVKIGGDISGLTKSLQTTEQALTKTASRMKSIGKTMSAAITLPILGIGTAITKLAMDAQESENLFEVSMGNMAKSARNWSNSLSQSLGLNSYEIRKNVGMLNAMFISMQMGEKASYNMSTGLTQLAYDMASFYNLNTEDAFAKLQAGISGETEPLKRLGILINETTVKQWALNKGLIKQGQELSEQQKVLARYGSIMEQTAQAQRDLARTLDSPANKLRVLKSRATELAIEFGNKLLPYVIKLLDKGLDLINWLDRMSPEMQNTTLTIVSMVAAAGPLLSILGSLIPVISTLGTVIGAIVSPIGVVTLAIVALIAKLSTLSNENKKVTTSMSSDWDNWGKNVTNVLNGVLNNIWKYLSSPNIKGLQYLHPDSKIHSSESKRVHGGGGGSFIPAGKIYADREKENQKNREQNKGLQLTNDWLTTVNSSFGDLGNTGTKVYDKLNDSIKSFVDSLKNQTDAYMNFVGVFDSANNQMAISGERWLSRLKGQLKATQTYQQSVAFLQGKAQSGVISNQLLNQLQSMGPGAAAQLQQLTKMSDSQLKKASGLYGQRLGLSQDMAYNSVMNSQKSDKATNQIIIQITGNTLMADDESVTDRLANTISKKLKAI